MPAYTFKNRSYFTHINNDLNDLHDDFSIYSFPEGYLELRQMSKMELFAKIVYGF